MPTTVRTSLGANSWVIEYAPAFLVAELEAHVQACMVDGGWTFDEKIGNDLFFFADSHAGVAKYKNGIRLTVNANAIQSYAIQYVDGVREPTSYQIAGSNHTFDVTSGGHYYMFVSPYWYYAEHNGNDGGREAGTMFMEFKRDCGTIPNDIDSHRWGIVVTNALSAKSFNFTSTPSVGDVTKENYTGGPNGNYQVCHTRAYSWGRHHYTSTAQQSNGFGNTDSDISLTAAALDINVGHALYDVALEIGVTVFNSTRTNPRFMGRPIGLKMLHRGEVTNITPIKTNSIGLLDSNGTERDHFIFQSHSYGYALALPL